MGREANCVLKRGSERHTGKALLETSEVIFRGESLRLKIPFARIKAVAAQEGNLQIETAEGSIVLEIGAAAGKWREKILNPKTRIEKLGVKPGSSVMLVGELEPEFLKEVKSATRNASDSNSANGTADWIFLALAGKKDQAKIGSTSRKLKGAAGLWIVYPKGKKEITEKEVISAGRKAGLKDVKVVAFSATHTALKFVIPVKKR